jgi:predicted CopG family antitoxin
MQKKLTITVDEEVYDGLYRTVGPRRISQFIEDLVRPHVLTPDLSDAYAQMAADEAREAEAEEWSEALLSDLLAILSTANSNQSDPTSQMPRCCARTHA